MEVGIMCNSKNHECNCNGKCGLSCKCNEKGAKQKNIIKYFNLNLR